MAFRLVIIFTAIRLTVVCKVVIIVAFFLHTGAMVQQMPSWCYGATVAIVPTYLPMMGDEMKDDTKYAVVTSPAM